MLSNIKLAELESSELDKAILSELSFYAYQSLLNISCGNGSLLAMIPRRKGLFLAGIDHIQDRLQETREKNGDKVELHCGSMPNLPWNNNHFDLVISTHSSHVALNLTESLQEIIRVLKPGGRIILTAPWRPSPIRQVINHVKTWGNKQHPPIFSEPEYVAILQENGFENIKWKQPLQRTCMVIAQYPKF